MAVRGRRLIFTTSCSMPAFSILSINATESTRHTYLVASGGNSNTLPESYSLALCTAAFISVRFRLYDGGPFVGLSLPNLSKALPPFGERRAILCRFSLFLFLRVLPTLGSLSYLFAVAEVRTLGNP